jgi:hypothetical protein
MLALLTIPWKGQFWLIIVLGETETVVVVPVVGIAAAAIRHPAVLFRNSGIVPAAAAQHTVVPPLTGFLYHLTPD